MTTFSSSLHALASQVSTDSSSAASNPTLVALWIGVGVLGLIAGVVTVTIAERRLRASGSPVATTAPVVSTDTALVATV